MGALVCGYRAIQLSDLTNTDVWSEDRYEAAKVGIRHSIFAEEEQGNREYVNVEDNCDCQSDVVFLYIVVIGGGGEGRRGGVRTDEGGL
ncbi:hypothetical protein RJZ57_000714 [Blastomyces gilchristii]